jgi:hypothetical protein
MPSGRANELRNSLRRLPNTTPSTVRRIALNPFSKFMVRNVLSVDGLGRWMSYSQHASTFSRQWIGPSVRSPGKHTGFPILGQPLLPLKSLTKMIDPWQFRSWLRLEKLLLLHLDGQVYAWLLGRSPMERKPLSLLARFISMDLGVTFVPKIVVDVSKFETLTRIRGRIL